MKPNFKTHQPQACFNEWEGRNVPIRFAGCCVVCHRNTYQTQEEEGNWKDPDPRGMIGDFSAAALEARDYGYTGEDVPVCYSCRDHFTSYTQALKIAKTKWQKL